ncbi:hypothetical protein S245_048042 [Arachis hypogaea]
MTQTQCQHLLSLLSSPVVQVNAPAPVQTDAHASSTIGITLFALTSLQLPNGCWILDSEASNYICIHLFMFHDYKPVSNSFITLPDNSHIPIIGIGSIRVTPQLGIHRVFYIPSFALNLLSISTLVTPLALMLHSHLIML